MSAARDQVLAAVFDNTLGLREPNEMYNSVVQSLDVVHVEALPNEMPEAIVVSIDSLEELDQSLAVSDITVPAGVTILSGGEQTIAQIARPRLEVEEEEAIPEGEEGAVPEGEEADSDDESSGDDD